jgi:hypothetical protein
MKGKNENTTSSFEKKGFPYALDVFFEENVPQLGGHLTRKAVVDRIIEMIDKYYPKTERLMMGQMVWFAIHKDEKAGYGKKLESCKQVPVILDVIKDTDIEAILDGVKKRERQKKVAVRLFQQAYKQNGVMTNADVATIMRLSPATISGYIREYEKKHNKIVPRRGTIHDMGRSISHKVIICRKYFYEGKSVEITARETYHSPQAVTRYINDFERVRECLKANWNVEKIAYTTNLSKNLTQEYVDMIEDFDYTF